MTKDEFADALEAGSASGNSWTPEKQGDWIIGTYVRKQEDVGPHDSNMYHLEVEGAEETTGVWGNTVLDKKFSEIPLNSRVKIEYLGMVKGKSASYKDFRVLYKPGVRIDDVNRDIVEGANKAFPDKEQ